MAAPWESLEDFGAEMARLAAAKAELEKKEDAAWRRFEALRRGVLRLRTFLENLGLSLFLSILPKMINYTKKSEWDDFIIRFF